MNSTIKLMLLISIAAMVNACEDESVHNSQIYFQFALQSDLKSMSSEVPAGSTLIIGLTSSTGRTIEKEVPADSRVSQGDVQSILMSLPPASYTIDDVVIVDENDRIVYASPRQHSVMGTRLKNPHTFSVHNANSLHLNLILFDAKNQKAENFGFKSFGRKQSINVSVFVEGSTQAVTGKAVIIEGESIIAEFDLQAKNNHLKFDADNLSTYTLQVTKSGYTTFRETFTILNLKRKGNNQVKAVVAPAFTMSAQPQDYGDGTFKFQFDLAGRSGTVYVNWGDGSTEAVQLTQTETNYLSHDYAASGTYPIEVTGDLNQITYFYSFYGQGTMDAIDLQHLTELTEIRFGLSGSPSILDLSHNSKLEYAMLPGLQNLEAVILPDNHRASMNLDGENLFTTDSFDRLISNLYDNTVRNNYAGVLTFAATWYQEEGDESTIAPVSQASREKMLIMKNTYGWGFYPDILD